MLHFSAYFHPKSTEWLRFIDRTCGRNFMWYSQIRHFKKNFNILLIDLRGHGKWHRAYL